MSIEKKHGRIDVRQYYVLNAKKLSKLFPQWKKLKSIGVAIGYRNEKGKNPTLDYRYYIHLAKLTEEELASGIRGHCGGLKIAFIGF